MQSSLWQAAPNQRSSSWLNKKRRLISTQGALCWFIQWCRGFMFPHVTSTTSFSCHNPVHRYRSSTSRCSLPPIEFKWFWFLWWKRALPCSVGEINLGDLLGCVCLCILNGSNFSEKYLFKLIKKKESLCGWQNYLSFRLFLVKRCLAKVLSHSSILFFTARK